MFKCINFRFVHVAILKSFHDFEIFYVSLNYVNAHQNITRSRGFNFLSTMFWPV